LGLVIRKLNLASQSKFDTLREDEPQPASKNYGALFA
jgi:hypothetical protein